MYFKGSYLLLYNRKDKALILCLECVIFKKTGVNKPVSEESES